MSRKSQGLNRLGSDLGGKYATVVAEDGEEHVQAAQPDLTLWQAVRKYRRTMLHCMGMTSAILMYGFDMVIVGTTASMPSFQQDFGQKYNGKWIIPSLWLSIWAFSSPGAAMLGAIFGGYFQDWFGRRASMVFGSVLTAVGVAIIFVSNLPEDIGTRRGVFTAGKAFQGVTIAIVMTTTQTYMSEVLPPVLRGPVLAFFPTFTLLGQLIGAAVIYACLGIEGDGYVVCFGVQWPFTLVPVVMAFLIPESPTYLVRKGSMAAALAAQRRLDEGTGADSQAAVAQLQKRIAEERAHGGAARATYLECFRGTNLRRTLIIMFSSLVPQIFGITILGKASYFIQLVGMDPDMSLMVLIIGIVAGFLANLTSVWLISRFERRVLSLSSLAALSVIWCSMGISGLWSGTATIWYTTASLIMAVVAAGLGVWPCSYAISGEASTLDLRSKSQGIAWMTTGATTGLFGFVMPYIFNADQGNLGAKTGFVYAGLCLVGLVVVYFCVPDMKGRTAAEIDMMFDERIDARKFRSWKNTSAADVASVDR